LLRAIAVQERARILQLGLVQTHVHVLLTAHPLTDWARLVQRLKGASSMQINRSRPNPHGEGLKWEAGYCLETVSPRQVPMVREYVRSQPRHHPLEAIEGWRGDLSTHELLR
jgi:REP element-mobilizing transposase RayT